MIAWNDPRIKRPLDGKTAGDADIYEMVEWLLRMARQFDCAQTNYGEEGREDMRRDAAMARKIAARLTTAARDGDGGGPN